jgi:hypothetical protein
LKDPYVNEPVIKAGFIENKGGRKLKADEDGVNEREADLKDLEDYM